MFPLKHAQDQSRVAVKNPLKLLEKDRYLLSCGLFFSVLGMGHTHLLKVVEKG